MGESQDDLGEVLILRDFAAPPAALYRTFLDPDALARFWGPPGVTTPREQIRVQPREGGRFETVMIDDATGDRYPMRARFTTLVPDEQWAFQDRDTGMVSQTLLDDLGDGVTRMMIRQTGVLPMHRSPQAVDGFLGSLDRLEELVVDPEATVDEAAAPPVTCVSSAEGVRITRTFRAPRDRVYAAWTTAEAFRLWFGGPTVQVPLDRLTFDAVAGSPWSAVMVLPDGAGEIPWRGEFRIADAPHHLAFSLSDAPEGGEDVVDVTLSVLDGDRTSMVFEQTGAHMPADQYAMAGVGWLGFFDAMAALVEERP